MRILLYMTIYMTPSKKYTVIRNMRSFGNKICWNLVIVIVLYFYLFRNRANAESLTSREHWATYGRSQGRKPDITLYWLFEETQKPVKASQSGVKRVRSTGNLAGKAPLVPSRPRIPAYFTCLESEYFLQKLHESRATSRSFVFIFRMY
jgi:hypothetical protein